MFPQFPYSNLHELNLDWIIEQLQRTMNFAVLSVNGQTGDVILYTDPNVEFPAIDSADWQIIRTANGRTVGVMFQNDKMYLRYGETLSEVYTADNPPTFPVTSVNGQTGAVVTYPDAAVRLPDVDDAYTNIRRQIDSSGTPAIVGIEVDKTKAVRMNGTLRKKIYDEDNQPPYPVTSVNGQTGAIVIAVPIEPLSIDQSLWQAAENSPNHTAGFSRFTLDGNVSIYLTSDSSKVEAYIDYLSADEQTSYTRKLLTTDDIPSAAGVVSINGMNGVVTIYGTDISMSSLDSRNLTNIITGLEADVPGIGESVAWYEPGNTASQNIRNGDYVIWNNAAYRANTNIFSGDPLSGSVLDLLTGGITNDLNYQMQRVDAKYSLILPDNAANTVQTFNTYSARKFSDYRILLFILYTSSSDRSVIRSCVYIPSTLWQPGKSIILSAHHGVNLGSLSGITIAYNTDTSVDAVLTGAGALTGFEIEGYVNI